MNLTNFTIDTTYNKLYEIDFSSIISDYCGFVFQKYSLQIIIFASVIILLYVFDSLKFFFENETLQKQIKNTFNIIQIFSEIFIIYLAYSIIDSYYNKYMIFVKIIMIYFIFVLCIILYRNRHKFIK